MKWLFLYFLLIFFLQAESQSVRVIPHSPLAKIAAFLHGTDEYALTWGNTIRISCNEKHFFADSLWTRHEFNHVAQWKKYGKVGFTLKYLFYAITRGYKRNPIEIEADSPKIK